MKNFKIMIPAMAFFMLTFLSSSASYQAEEAAVTATWKEDNRTYNLTIYCDCSSYGFGGAAGPRNYKTVSEALNEEIAFRTRNENLKFTPTYAKGYSPSSKCGYCLKY